MIGLEEQRQEENEAGSSVCTPYSCMSFGTAAAAVRRELELNGVSIGSMRKLLFSTARGPFICDAETSACNGFGIFVVRRRETMSLAFQLAEIIYSQKMCIFHKICRSHRGVRC